MLTFELCELPRISSAPSPPSSCKTFTLFCMPVFAGLVSPIPISPVLKMRRYSVCNVSLALPPAFAITNALVSIPCCHAICPTLWKLR